MNKNLKRIMAMALVFGTVSAVAPATNVNLLTTKAYASDDENDETSLDSLELQTSSGSTIKLYSDNDYASDNKVDNGDVTDGEEYYAKTSSSTINIDIDGPSNKYVKVFKGTSDSTKGKSISNDISLSEGTTVLTVRVYNNEPDSDVRYDDEDDMASDYVIKVKCTASDSSDSSDSDTEDSSADDYDDIYLDSLSVEGESITLSDSKIDYSYDVANDVDEVTIKAKPEDEDEDTVTIDGDDVDDTDKYKNTVSLDEGANEFKIEIEDEDSNYREYTLTVNRASTSSDSTSTSNEATTAASTATAVDTAVATTTTVVANKWVQVNGLWQYNDSIGNAVKSSWVGNYYLRADANMATGWLSDGGKWYYLGTDGAMKKGWQSVNGTWYYMDTQGIMAYSTTINGYKLGASGAWVK